MPDIEEDIREIRDHLRNLVGYELPVQSDYRPPFLPTWLSIIGIFGVSLLALWWGVHLVRHAPTTMTFEASVEYLAFAMVCVFGGGIGSVIFGFWVLVFPLVQRF